MSLGAIDFGLIVDGAVIIVESTLHILGVRKNVTELSQTEMNNEVEHAATKIMKSAVFGQLIILIVYLPHLTLSRYRRKNVQANGSDVDFRHNWSIPTFSNIRTYDGFFGFTEAIEK